MCASVTRCPPETRGDQTRLPEDQAMSKKCKTKGSVTDAAKSATVTLADLFISLQHETSLSATRLRDLQSAVKRVASLLGQDAAAIPRLAGDQRQARRVQPGRGWDKCQDIRQPPVRLSYCAEGQWIEARSAFNQDRA
jgi:hypothetical protein